MDDRLLWAAENNARWCNLVCRSHGIPTVIEGGLWAALRRTPELYPDAVTLRPDQPPAHLLAIVDDSPGCSVKDSFTDLDLAPLGFVELFQAQWIWREPCAPAAGVGVDWNVVGSPAEFDEWVQAADLAGILRSGLDQSARVLAVRGLEGISAGAIANRSGSVVGVSNVFTRSIAPVDAWASLAARLEVMFPSSPLVGYERGDDLEAALAAGFRELGPLRVWLR